MGIMLLRFIAVTTAVTLCCSTMAFAQTAGRVVVFGDSLSDPGNLGPNGPPAPPYGTGPNGRYRFSSGLNYADIMFGAFNSPFINGRIDGNVDLAFGGARTDTLLNPTGGPTTPSIPFQVGAFLGSGGTFGPNDLVVAWGGANNLFQYVGPLTQAGLGANSIAAADSMSNNVLRPILAAGGRTLLVPNLPDFGALPAYNGSTATAQAGTFASTAYNQQLASNAATLAAANPQANIVQADVAAAFRVVVQNPAAFGITNATQSCSTGVSVCATPSTFLFWDTVHPTQAGYQLLANYFSLLLNTAPAIAQTQSLGDITGAQTSLVSGAVFDRMTNWFSGTYAGKNGPFAEVIGQTGNYEDEKAGRTSGYRFTTGGIRAGYDQAFGNTLAGLSVAVLSGGQSGTVLNSDVFSVRGDVYGTMVAGPFYLSGNAGVTQVQFSNVQRDTGFPTITAKGSTDATVLSATAEVGVAQRFGGITLIPSARIGYASATVDGYSETADVLALSFAEREIESVTGGVRLRAVSDMNIGGLVGTMFAEVGYESFLSYDGGQLKGKLVANTAAAVIVNPADPSGQGFIGKLGLNGQVSENVFLDLNYAIALGDGNGEVHTGQARLKAHF
jgi:outer membrane lipase/esterase